MLEIINGILSSAAITISVYFYGYILFKEKDSKLNSKLYNAIAMLLSIILYAIIFLYLNNIIKTILLCVLFALTLKFIFNITYGKALLASIIFTILLIIPDLITLAIATQIFDNKEFVHINIAGTILTNIVISILMILLTLFLKKILKKIINYNLSTNKKIIVVSILTLLSLAIFFYNFINTFRLNNGILGYIIIIITLITVLFYLFKQKMDNDVILKKYDDLLNIMKNYENDIEEQRIMVHENRNELMTIKSKINDKEKESSIIKYIDSILGDKVGSKMSKYSKFKYLPSNGIKGFFYYKFNEAEEKNIKVSVNISKKIENSFLGKLDTKDFKDLVRIIGVYLDNAIDACSESLDKKLGIEIYLNKENIEIIISNTFINKINIDKIGKEKFTTKGKNRGHGLLLVKHILHNNSIFESNNEIINGLYIQKLKIKDINKKTQ